MPVHPIDAVPPRALNPQPIDRHGSRRRSSPRQALRPSAALAAATLVCMPAQAHVKWFADWSLMICPPRDPMRVLSMPLWQALFAAAIVCMAWLAWFDKRLATRGVAPSRPPTSGWQRMHVAAASRAFDLLRLGLCAHWLLVSFTLTTTVYLTPELAAPSWVRWLQAACAVVVLSRSSCWLAGLGLISMYLMACADHGWFHLLDYPVFLALGIILLLPAWQRSPWCRRTAAEVDALGLDLLRWSAALTLLWGGIEKFAFPEWSFGMMEAMPMLRLGVSAETAMYLYGFGELALAFAMLAFGIGSQVAAALLLLVFVAAVPPFGWVDLVGHSGIVVALLLLTIVAPRQALMQRFAARSRLLQGLSFPAVVLGLWGAYTGLHGLYLQNIVADPATEARARAQRSDERSAQATSGWATLRVGAAVDPVGSTGPALRLTALTTATANATATAKAPADDKPGLRAEVEATIAAWAKAWSRRDVTAYFAHYSEDFMPPAGLSREHWQELRHRRIGGRRNIEVTVSDLRLDTVSANRVVASYTQAYAADDYVEAGTRKRLLLAQEPAGWRIVTETVVR